MKEIIFEKYKLINLALFIIVLAIVFALYMYVTLGHCVDNCSLDLKQGIINPVFMGGKWFAGILGVLLFIPSRIFRKWLLYVAPVILLLTFTLVQGISINSGNLLNPTRGKMAENGMMLLAFVTVIFVVSHFVYEWRKKKVSKPA